MDSNKNLDSLVQRVKSANVSYTVFGESIYSNLWYTDNKNKLCVTFTPRGGCSISFLAYLDIVGLLEDGLSFSNFIHDYRVSAFCPNIAKKEINDLVKENYTFIKFIMNPYVRAVSIFNAQRSHNLSFREYLKQLNSNSIGYFTNNDKFHYHQQYIQNEEKIITKYIKIDKYEKYNITLADGSLHEIDVNYYAKYMGHHHGTKNPNNTEFCGDEPHNKVIHNLPKSYKYFYDDEIKQLVEQYYKEDIDNYSYSFDDFLL